MMTAPTGIQALGVCYLLIGAGVAWWLQRQHHPAGAVIGALVAWPLLLPLLGTGRPPSAHGHHAARIDDALDALLRTLEDPAAEPMDVTADLTTLRASMHRLDARLRLVDRLLEDEPTAPSADRLRAARDEAVADIEGVLEDVAELRVQVGLMALAGDGATVRARVHELHLRTATWDEVGALHASTL